MAKLTEDNLDPNFKKAWVKALRSGDYRQGTYRLKGEDGFCCLGVMREVCQGVKKKPGDEILLPKSCGLTLGTQDFLATKNDIDSWGFKRIATWIEKNL